MRADEGGEGGGQVLQELQVLEQEYAGLTPLQVPLPSETSFTENERERARASERGAEREREEREGGEGERALRNPCN
jgi:hypothetical protein